MDTLQSLYNIAEKVYELFYKINFLETCYHHNFNVGEVRLHIEKWGIGCINAVLQYLKV